MPSIATKKRPTFSPLSPDLNDFFCCDILKTDGASVANASLFREYSQESAESGHRLEGSLQTPPATPIETNSDNFPKEELVCQYEGCLEMPAYCFQGHIIPSMCKNHSLKGMIRCPHSHEMVAAGIGNVYASSAISSEASQRKTTTNLKKPRQNPWKRFEAELSEKLTWENRLNVISSIPVPDNCYFIHYKPATMNKFTGQTNQQFVCSGFRRYDCDLYLKVVLDPTLETTELFYRGTETHAHSYVEAAKFTGVPPHLQTFISAGVEN